MIIFIANSMTFASEPIKLLVRGDDMGINYGATLGIIKAHKEGIVTSASIMPTSQYFDEAVKLCKQNPSLAVGLHITLVGSRERPVLPPEEVLSLVTPNGFFYEWGTELDKANPRIEEIEKEIMAQIEKALSYRLNFVYLDWHRSVPKYVEDIILRICKERHLIFGQDKDGALYGYKWVDLAPESWPCQIMPDGQCFYYNAPAFNEKEFRVFFNALNDLKTGNWMTAVHPGTGGSQRESITEIMCSPKTKGIIKKKKIQLISYYDIWKEIYGKM